MMSKKLLTSFFFSMLACMIFSTNLQSQNCSWSQLNYSNFESGWGIWNDSDIYTSDSQRNYGNGYQSNYSIRIRDNDDDSYTVTNNLNLSSVDEVKIDFAFKANSMENGEDFFLEYSLDGGNSFTTIQQWVSNVHFTNGNYISESVTLSQSFTSSTQFRFRCDASSNFDEIFLDNITISTCEGSVVEPPTASSCNYFQQDNSDFSSGFGFWKDGGYWCELRSGALRLKSDHGHESSSYTAALDYSNVSKVELDFKLRFQSMEYGEDLLLQYSTNGGSSYQTAHRWISGQNIQNSSSYSNHVIEIEGPFSSQTVFRFQCDASSSADYVYIDDIKLSSCTESNDPNAGNRDPYRTLDGTLNNLENPTYGTVGTPLFREVSAQYADGQNSLAGANRPSPRHISNQLSDEPQDRRDERLLSGMAYQFGQFVDHDIVFTEPGNESANIPVPSYDPIFTPNSVIPFRRTAPIPGSSPRQQPNGFTSYIDASNVYGVDAARAAWLRTGQDGKLKTSKGNLLPYNTTDGEWDSPTSTSAPRMDRDMRGGQLIKLAVAGDIRANEHPNLTAFHTLFVREHNRLCDHFKSQGESDDEVIYQKARKLVGAMMQRIVYREYLPAFGVSTSSYSGYNPNVRPDVRNTFATAAYRWHTMVENDIILRNDACEGVGVVELPLKTIFANPLIIRQYGVGVLLRGLAFHPQYRTDLKVNNGLRNFLFGPGAGLDLVSINLQRGRDHGLPDYKTVRSHYGLGSISSFSSINSDSDVSSKLQNVYGNVNNIDLWAGIFAEPLVSGTSLPATALAIVKKQFEVIRDGDFYFYKNDPFLTSSDLNIINSSDLASIIERNTSARSMPSNIFFKPPCDDSDPLEDLNDHDGTPVCNESGATFVTSCTSSFGSSKNVGTYYETNVQKINVRLGYAVRIYNNQGQSTYFTDDTGCLPLNFRGGNISAIDVICLSDDDSTIDCSGFAGALFSHCFSSPLPIFTPGSYNTEQLKSLSVEDNDISAIRVNNGFKVILYQDDNFEDHYEEYVGPIVTCLPWSMRNRMSSMKVICLSDPDRSNCGFNGVAGAVFPHSESDEDRKHIGTSLGIGDYTSSRMNQMGLSTNDIEQVKVNNGYAITLFDNDNYGGWSETYVGDESDLGWTRRNDASSMKVRCIESLQNFIAEESVLSFAAKKDSEDARLDVNFSLVKEASYQTIDKYNGATGEFETIETITSENLSDSYSIYDRNVSPGDNVYRVKVYYVDGTEEEAPYRSLRFAAPIHLYPNPASDVLNVDLHKYIGSDVEVTLYDIRGLEIANKKLGILSQSTVSFNTSEIMPGTYVTRVVADGKVINKKFVVAK